MNPGTTYRLVASMILAPGGIGVVVRGPRAAIRRPATIITASATGAPPLPSISVPPTIAMFWAIAGKTARRKLASVVFRSMTSDCTWAEGETSTLGARAHLRYELYRMLRARGTLSWLRP